MKNKDIYVFGTARSGTTLIWNLVREILPDCNVMTNHIFICYFKKVIITLRDFRDCMCSLYKRRTGRSKFGFISLLRYIILIKRYIRSLDKYINSNRSLLILRYKIFRNDFDYVFDNLEDFFDIKISSSKRNLLKKKYNLQELKKTIPKYNEPRDLVTMMHDKHINKGEIGQWKHMIPEHLHSFVYFLLRDKLLKYGFTKYGKVKETR